MSGWMAIAAGYDGTPATVHPLGDIFEHDVESEDCMCCPFWDGAVLVHRAFDGRECREVPVS